MPDSDVRDGLADSGGVPGRDAGALLDLNELPGIASSPSSSLRPSRSCRLETMRLRHWLQSQNREFESVTACSIKRYVGLAAWLREALDMLRPLHDVQG